MAREDIRNVAIIAHVDHGKTTLVDQLLRQSGHFRQDELTGECILDSNPLERERGITILSKNCAFDYPLPGGKRVHINLVDTPGHADFSGEVERVIAMADGALLLVDALDGVMPQTRYVASKALTAGLKPIVVINKMDRPDARPEAVADEVIDLLVEYGMGDKALDVPVLYASGRDGWAVADPKSRPEPGKGHLKLLFDAILTQVPPPGGDPAAPLQAQVTTLDYNDYVGRIGIGRVYAGALREGAVVAVMRRDGSTGLHKAAYLWRFDGLGRARAPSVEAGDLFAVAGLEAIDIGDTIADPEHAAARPRLPVDEPTIHMRFRINDSPFAGRDGRFVTGRQIRDRLNRELQSNVALRVDDHGDEFIVHGRGVLHLGILIENLRREGFELCVGKPEVEYRTVDGRKCEPMETLVVDVPSETVGTVMQLVGDRRAELLKMDSRGTHVRMEFDIPARGLIGLRGRMLSATQGLAVLHHRFREYAPARGPIPGRPCGVLVATQPGRVTTYALEQLADRGVMFVVPGDEIYEGQIVGEHTKGNDIDVNAAKTKTLNNMRTSTKEATVTLKAPRRLDLEPCLEYIEEDEFVEITPAAVRLRKRWLSCMERRVRTRREAEAAGQRGRVKAGNGGAK